MGSYLWILFKALGKEQKKKQQQQLRQGKGEERGSHAIPLMKCVEMVYLWKPGCHTAIKWIIDQ